MGLAALGCGLRTAFGEAGEYPATRVEDLDLWHVLRAGLGVWTHHHHHPGVRMGLHLVKVAFRTLPPPPKLLE